MIKERKINAWLEDDGEEYIGTPPKNVVIKIISSPK